MSAHPKATQSTFRQSLQMMRFFKEVPNSKNTVRDQLANERSFLAFARASIMLLASVISITQVYKKILIQDQVKQLLNLPSDDTHQSSSLLKAYIALNSTYSTIVRPLTIFATAASLIIAIMGFFRYILNLNLLLNDKRFSPFTVSAFVIIIFCAVISQETAPSVTVFRHKPPNLEDQMNGPSIIRKRTRTKADHKIARAITEIVEQVSPIKGPENETRDHLSNERTFLAYIRTGGSFVAMGITIIMLGRFSVTESISRLGDLQELEDGKILEELKHDEMVVDKYCNPAGIVVAVSGIITIVCGAIRYTINYKLLDRARNVFMSGSLFSSIIFCTLIAVTVLTSILISQV